MRPKTSPIARAMPSPAIRNRPSGRDCLAPPPVTDDRPEYAVVGKAGRNRRDQQDRRQRTPELPVLQLVDLQDDQLSQSSSPWDRRSAPV